MRAHRDAKAPRPGKVKTRLSPPLTPEQASALNACFLRDTIASLARRNSQMYLPNGSSPTRPIGEEAAFGGILPDGAPLILPARRTASANACSPPPKTSSPVDSPPSVSSTPIALPFLPKSSSVLLQQLTPCCWRSARRPRPLCEDGGYYLIGLQQSHARLFEDIAWSTVCCH